MSEGLAGHDDGAPSHTSAWAPLLRCGGARHTRRPGRSARASQPGRAGPRRHRAAARECEAPWPRRGGAGRIERHGGHGGASSGCWAMSPGLAARGGIGGQRGRSGGRRKPEMGGAAPRGWRQVTAR
ncbi:hypothetical protein BS78_04G106300 [Paspalum vaginatum]|nr:hypothetical protein BS78_04G106300 [Paspalum vaginatum]